MEIDFRNNGCLRRALRSAFLLKSPQMFFRRDRRARLRRGRTQSLRIEFSVCQPICQVDLLGHGGDFFPAEQSPGNATLGESLEQQQGAPQIVLQMVDAID